MVIISIVQIVSAGECGDSPDELKYGALAEWSNATVLKTVNRNGSKVRILDAPNG